MPLYLLRPRPLPSWIGFTKSSTPPGCRWITVHPDGPDEPGRPVLIRESATSPGQWHVIGGAGGKLNHLTLTHVGTPEEHAERAKQKRKERQEKLKQARARGEVTPEDEEEITEESRKNQRQFVDAVAKKLGWDQNWYKDATDFQREGMSPTAAKLAANAHLRSWAGRASQAHKDLKEQLRRDHEARIDAGLGNLSLDSNPYRATAEELQVDHLSAQAQAHRAQAQEAALRASEEAEQEADTYDQLAGLLKRDGDDDELAEMLGSVGRPNTPQARKVLQELQFGNIEASTAAKQLKTLAGQLRDGNLALDSGNQAKAHLAAADLYQQALDAAHQGQGDAAARYTEEAKKLAGERGVSALDLIGEKQSEGRGYKAPERKRARRDVAEEGLDTPEAIERRIGEVGQAIESVVQRAQDGVWEGGMPVGVIDALQQQQLSLRRAKEAAERGDRKAAADFVLQAERYEVAEAKHADRSAKAQAVIVDATARMRAAHAEVRGAKEEGDIQIGAGDLTPEVKSMAAARDILVAAEKYKERQQQLQEARRLLTEDAQAARELVGDPRVRPEPLDPDAQDAVVQDALRKIREDASTGFAQRLLERLEDDKYFASYGGERQVSRGALGKYIAQGQDAVMNLLGQVIGGGQMIDRPTLDVLGSKAASRLLADYLANTRTPQELAAIRKGLEDYHVGRAADVASGALRACDESMERARDFELRGAGSAYDLSEMEQYNRLRLDAVNQAMASVGTAYGELNMTAELVWALSNAKAKPGAGVKIDGGARSDEALVVLAHSLGLKRGEYEIEGVRRPKGAKRAIPGGVKLTDDGVRRIVRETPTTERKSAERLASIKRGEDTTADDGTPIAGDQDGWLPKGIARRPLSTWQIPEKRPDRYDAEPPQEVDGLRAYAANRIMRGQDPAQVYLELRNQAGDESEAWHRHVNEMFRIGDDENFDHGFLGRMQQRAERLVAEHQAATGQGSPLDRQGIGEDGQTVEAIHRALATNPYGTLAFKGVGDLSSSDRQHVRDYYFKHIARQPTAREAQEMRAAGHPDAPALDPYRADCFGNPIGDPEKTGEEGPGDYRWDRYAGSFARPEAAYEAVLDHLKGQTLQHFAHAYGQVTGVQLDTGAQRLAHAHEHYLGTAPTQHTNDLMARFGQEWRATRDGSPNNQELEAGLQRQVELAAPTATHQGAQALDRFTLGRRTEAQLAGLWGGVADNFLPGRPVKLVPNLRMDGQFVNQQRAVKAIRAQKRVAMFLGVGCIAADTQIYDPVRRMSRTVAWWMRNDLPLHVFALNSAGEPVVARASRPFIKARETMYRVTTARGAAITVAAGHRFLTPEGWTTLRELRVGDVLAAGGSWSSVPRHQPFVVGLPRSSWELDHEGSPQDARHSSRTHTGSTDHCWTLAPVGGEPPPTTGVAGQEPAPSPVDARERTQPHWRRGDSGTGSGRSRPCRWSGLLATPRCSPQAAPQDATQECSELYDIAGRPLPMSLQDAWRSAGRTDPAPRVGATRRRERGAATASLRDEPCSFGSPSLTSDNWDQITDIVPDGDGYVYDLEVYEYHNYLAHGLWHHNSGKTLISLAGFTDAHHHGEARGALFAVPQNMQGQFGAEAATYIDPSAGIKWHAQPGADGAERQRALASTGHHICVTTHQSLRDDVVKAVAESDHQGDTKKAEQFLMEQPRGLRAAAVKRAFEKKGWAHRLDYFAMDEGHEALNRKGKPNSLLANVMDAISDNAKHYVPMTGTPVKNDPSEAYDWLQKVRPDLYTDEGREDFLRSYDGLLQQTPRINEARQGQRGKGDPKDWRDLAMAEAVQRAVSPHFFATRVPLNTKLNEKTVRVDLSPAHQKRYDAVTDLFREANGARAKGEVATEAIRKLSPESFVGLPPEQHEARAKELAASLGMLREAAYNRVLHTGGKDNAKLDALSKEVARLRGERSARGHVGKAGIVFTTGIDAAHQIAKHLRSQGHRVGLITGELDGKAKDREKEKFQPGDWKTNGEASAKTDILVATNAVQAGADLPRGEFVIHHDVPMTAKAQPLDALILTPSGWKPMGEIVVGDAVIAGDGSVTEVVGVYPQGLREVFRVEMTDGSATRTCADHLWLTRTKRDRRSGRAGEVRMLRDIATSLRVESHTNHVIPLVGPVAFVPAEVPLDPYAFGVLLGDGWFGPSIVRLTTADVEIAEAVREACEATGGRMRQVEGYDYALTGDGSHADRFPLKKINPVLEAVRALGLEGKHSWEKFIPQPYLINTPEVRLAVLQGLLDTDGTVDKRNGSVSFCSTSRHLVEDVQFLVRSLGGVATTSAARTESYQHNGEARRGRDAWRVAVMLPAGVAPFRLARKLQYAAKGRSRFCSRGIAAIHPVGEMETQCIAVAHWSHLYVTDDFIVTHNTHEQRTARAYRLSNNSDVQVVNLVSNTPHEMKNLARLKTKYGLADVFQNPAENLDDSGLARHINFHRIAEGVRATQARQQRARATGTGD